MAIDVRLRILIRSREIAVHAHAQHRVGPELLARPQVAMHIASATFYRATARNATQCRAMAILSVCLSVCQTRRL